MAHPSFKPILSGLTQIPFTNPKYLYLAAANIGGHYAMDDFHQQSAVVDKGLTLRYKIARPRRSLAHHHSSHYDFSHHHDSSNNWKTNQAFP